MYNAFRFLANKLIKLLYEDKIMARQKFFKILFFSILITAVSTFAHAGTISGVVTYKGKVPKFREIKMDADLICLSKHTEKVFPQTLVLGPGNEMANVFIYIKDGIFDNPFPAPTEPVILSQEGCMYAPHVVGLMVGQPLKILNPDGTLHNVHALSKINPEFNLAMPKFRRETTKIFGKAEFMFPIKCDVHPWMAAWISVMDHPYFDITGEDGQFTINMVPSGRFTIEAWHEKLGTATESVLVTRGSNDKINFTFSKP